MKQFYTLFLVFAMHFSFGQINPEKYDYFIQFNGNQLSKKVSIDAILNHPIITKYTSKKPDFDFRKYTSIIQMDQKITIHGNFLDSIPYYQITIPIKSREAVKQYLIEKFNADQNAGSGEKGTIQDFGKYSVFTPKEVKKSLVWDDKYLVIFELTKRLPAKFNDITSPLIITDSIASTEVYDVGVPAEYIEPAADTIKPSVLFDAPMAVEAPPINHDPAAEDYSYNDNPYAEYTAQEADFDKKQSEKQSQIIKSLFENGFTPPVSTKVTPSADISSWLNYSSVISTLNSSYSLMSLIAGYNKFMPLDKNFAESLKGINLDFYFDNDNARIEEIIEYSGKVAEVVSKISNRKPNKNIFNYFPSQKPLGYMSYHINTKAALENFPSLMSDLFQSPKLLKEDITVITDLISTIVDEEATAKLFDGDLSFFLHDVKEVEVTAKKYGYDENYEEKITEEKVKKTIPLFSVIFTSTHPTFGDKLLQLGVRKKVLVQKGNDYVITDVKEYGDIFIRKDKDVVIIGNTLNYFNTGSGSFVKEAKQDLSKNYMFGKMNIAQSINAFGNAGKAKPEELNKILKVSEQFTDIVFDSPKKITNNKLKFELRLNASKSDKNIILQTLDLAQELTEK